MIEWLGFIYGIFKDLKKYHTYEDGTKKVNAEYVEYLKKKLKESGENFRFYWSNEEEVEARKVKGWDCYYQIDEKKKKKYLLLNKSDQILMAQKLIEQ